MAEELWNVAQVAGNREKLECAKYFEDIGALDKAVILYYRGGMFYFETTVYNFFNALCFR